LFAAWLFRLAASQQRNLLRNQPKPAPQLQKLQLQKHLLLLPPKHLLAKHLLLLLPKHLLLLLLKPLLHLPLKHLLAKLQLHLPLKHLLAVLTNCQGRFSSLAAVNGRRHLDRPVYVDSSMLT
jgi:hypothetical protein